MYKKIAAVAAATALALAPVSGANAATLPAGETLFVFSWAGGFFSVDTATGASTELFDLDIIVESAGSDFNPIDGQIYVLNNYGNCNLVVIDPITETYVQHDITVNSGNHDTCRAIDINTDGVIHAVLDDESLYVIDGATGAATQIGDIGATGDGITGLATNPVTGTLYAESDSDNFFAVDPETGQGTPMTGVDNAINGFFDFDSNGVLWYTGGNELYSISDVGSWEDNFESIIESGATESGFVAPSDFSSAASQSGVGLADTGVDAAPLLGFAALAVVAGAVAVRSRRRV